MTTAIQLDANIATKLETLLPFSPARMASDLRDDLESIPPGVTRYQLQAFAGPITLVKDSGAIFDPGISVVVRVHYQLKSAEAERDWTQTAGGMHTALETMLDRAFWEPIVGVFTVDVPPEAPEGSVTRIGGVVSFEVRTQLTLDVAA